MLLFYLKERRHFPKNGFIRSSNIQMGVLKGIRLHWLLEVIYKKREWITMKHFHCGKNDNCEMYICNCCEERMGPFSVGCQ